jgi:SHS2 domain-containing protein
MNSFARFEPIDHTADVGYRLFAPSLPELFAVGGRALFDAITELDTVQTRVQKSLSVQAADREALLVAWLSELNFFCLTEFLLFARFDIQSLTETHVAAIAHGEKIDPRRHEIKTEIKAVTYHGLYVRATEQGWEAQVIFDV